MAFQPIVDVQAREIYAYEALVRGPEGQPAGWVFEQLRDGDIYHFDQACRVTALRSAARLGLHRQGLPTRLSINMLPNAVYEPANCLRSTLRTAQEVGFPLERLMFEITEHEQVGDQAHLRRIIDTYRAYGLTTALDDYGSGHAAAGLLLALRPDVLKVDMGIVRGVHQDAWREALIRHLTHFGRETGLLMIAEGIETVEEARCLLALGITHMQGYFFARPGFECLPEVPGEVFDQLGR
ncbi:hypothetical protein DEIPH_ctg002orf0092 [Deinococcus phoenicis]|uniref:EAL domain-containing protein n=2 Tax=Deinococcus phoenicis TaxID=1476583 RepID=A0A016QUJ8_9DEIO|nr:hypothetical protein DEIPH_ctg002orf0092 [Deinococcus phoenicis]